MTITYVEQLAAGNALRIYITPPATAKWWRLLRNTVDAFVDQNDPLCTLVGDSLDGKVLVDAGGLQNGIKYFYRTYYWDGAAWTAGTSNSGTPAATYVGDDIDPLVTVRDRLITGLATEVLRGTLKPKSGVVPVMTAPFSSPENITFPCVSVHLDSDTPPDRAIGETVSPDPVATAAPDGIGGLVGAEGWISQASINIIGLSLNPDERITLRKVIKRIIIANLPVFEGLAISHIQFSQRDSEDFTSSNAPIFRTDGTFSCLFPAYIADSLTTPIVTDVLLITPN